MKFSATYRPGMVELRLEAESREEELLLGALEGHTKVSAHADRTGINLSMPPKALRVVLRKPKPVEDL